MITVQLEIGFAVFVVCAIAMIVVIRWRSNHPRQMIWSIRIIALIAMTAIVGGILLTFGAKPFPLFGSFLVTTFFCVQICRVIVCDQCGFPRFRDHGENNTELHDADCPIVLRHQRARMIEPQRISGDIRQSAPDRFRILTWSDRAVAIEHCGGGMSGLPMILMLFAIVFAVLPTLFLAWSLGWIDINSDTPNGEPPPLSALAIGWVFVALLLGLSLVLAFTKKRFELGPDVLQMTTSLFGLSWRTRILKDQIVGIAQINRGGDRAPNWALRLCGKRRFWLLSCLPYGHTEWLGMVIARWANVPVRILRQIDAPTPEPDSERVEREMTS